MARLNTGWMMPAPLTLTATTDTDAPLVSVDSTLTSRHSQDTTGSYLLPDIFASGGLSQCDQTTTLDSGSGSAVRAPAPPAGSPGSSHWSPRLAGSPHIQAPHTPFPIPTPPPFPHPPGGDHASPLSRTTRVPSGEYKSKSVSPGRRPYLSPGLGSGFGRRAEKPMEGPEAEKWTSLPPPAVAPGYSPPTTATWATKPLARTPPRPPFKRVGVPTPPRVVAAGANDSKRGPTPLGLRRLHNTLLDTSSDDDDGHHVGGDHVVAASEPMVSPHAIPLRASVPRGIDSPRAVLSGRPSPRQAKPATSRLAAPGVGDASRENVLLASLRRCGYSPDSTPSEQSCDSPHTQSDTDVHSLRGFQRAGHNVKAPADVENASQPPDNYVDDDDDDDDEFKTKHTPLLGFLRLKGTGAKSDDDSDSDSDDAGRRRDSTTPSNAFGTSMSPSLMMGQSRHSFRLQQSAAMEVDEFGNTTVNGMTLWRELGAGASATVFLGLEDEDDPTVAPKAVKVIDRAVTTKQPMLCRGSSATPSIASSAPAAVVASSEGNNVSPSVCASEPQVSLAEVDVLRALERHPHIVTLHECIDDPEHDQVYLVMDFVPDGPVVSLDAETGTCEPLPVEDVLTYGQHLASALAHVHSHGVVHGDVKPDNLLIDRSKKHAYLADFGVARILDEARDEGIALESLEACGVAPTSPNRPASIDSPSTHFTLLTPNSATDLTCGLSFSNGVMSKYTTPTSFMSSRSSKTLSVAAAAVAAVAGSKGALTEAQRALLTARGLSSGVRLPATRTVRYLTPAAVPSIDEHSLDHGNRAKPSAAKNGDVDSELGAVGEAATSASVSLSSSLSSLDGAEHHHPAPRCNPHQQKTPKPAQSVNAPATVGDTQRPLPPIGSLRFPASIVTRGSSNASGDGMLAPLSRLHTTVGGRPSSTTQRSSDRSLSPASVATKGAARVAGAPTVTASSSAPQLAGASSSGPLALSATIAKAPVSQERSGAPGPSAKPPVHPNSHCRTTPSPATELRRTNTSSPSSSPQTPQRGPSFQHADSMASLMSRHDSIPGQGSAEDESPHAPLNVQPKFVPTTPLFAAPEFLEGTAPAPPADLWAAGVTLYALLLGRLPFLGSLRELCVLVPEGDVPRPKDGELSDIGQSVFDTVILPLLSVPPSERPTAMAMELRLREIETAARLQLS